jgi:hypothetical protein
MGAGQGATAPNPTILRRDGRMAIVDGDGKRRITEASTELIAAGMPPRSTPRRWRQFSVETRVHFVGLLAIHARMLAARPSSFFGDRYKSGVLNTLSFINL